MSAACENGSVGSVEAWKRIGQLRAAKNSSNGAPTSSSAECLRLRHQRMDFDAVDGELLSSSSRLAICSWISRPGSTEMKGRNRWLCSGQNR